MPHAEQEHSLRIQLATALRELEEEKALAMRVGERAWTAEAERDELEEALAAARMECEGLRKAGDRLLVLWADFTSQETYGEHLRAGLEKSDFDDWDEAHENLRVEMER